MPFWKSAAQAPRTDSFCGSPMPAFWGESQSFTGRKPGTVESSGERGGSEVIDFGVPSWPLLSGQQLPLFDAYSSHQKSTPFGDSLPSGVRLITFFVYMLPFDVVAAPPGVHGGAVPLVFGAQLIASGTDISIVPRRQFSQMELPFSVSSLPPPISIPTPIGTGTDDFTSESGP